MAIQFVPGQVAVGDPSPVGPTALSGPAKDVQCKVVKLSSANFGLSAVNTLVAALPADATILEMFLWVKTQLSGGGITAATINIGTSSGGTQFASAFSAFGAAGVYTQVSPINGIMQPYQIPQGSDVQIFVGGTATTGAPTAGEMYLTIKYVR